MRGIDALRRNGIPFHVICVVTEATLDAADELMDFFLQEDIRDIGFNIEEIEGINRTSSLLKPGIEARYRSFLHASSPVRGRPAPPVTIREQHELLAACDTLRLVGSRGMRTTSRSAS